MTVLQTEAFAKFRKNFAKFSGKQFCQSVAFNKVALLQPATLLNKETLAQMFWYELCQNFRTSILWNICEQLFCRGQYIDTIDHFSLRIFNSNEIIWTSDGNANFKISLDGNSFFTWAKNTQSLRYKMHKTVTFMKTFHMKLTIQEDKSSLISAIKVISIRDVFRTLSNI